MEQNIYTDSIRNIDIELICLDDRFGELKFNDIVKILQRIKYDLVELEDLDYRSNLTHQEISSINSARNQFNNFIAQIQGFSLVQGNPQDLKNNIENQVKQFYDSSFASLTRSSLIYLRQQLKLDNKTEKELSLAVANAKKIEKDLIERLDKIKNDEVAVAKGSGLVSSKYLSAEFENQFNVHEKEAEEKWFKWIMYCYPALPFFIALAFVVYLVIKNKFPNDKSLLIEWGIFSTLIISVMFFGLKFIVNNYNIHKNLSSINRHRRNVAQTLVSFIESDKSTEVMHSVILKDASCALFEHHSNGYLSKDQMQISTPVQEMVTQIIKDKV